MTIKHSSKSVVFGDLDSELSIPGFECLTAKGRGVDTFLARDCTKITHVILHTPGPGPARRSKQLKSEDLVYNAAWIYQYVMNECAHFVTGVKKVVQTAPLDRRASHVGSNVKVDDGWFPAKRLYGGTSLKMNAPKWWLELAGNDVDLYACLKDSLRTGSYNEVSIGIEMAYVDKATVMAVVTALKEKVPSIRWLTHHAAINPLSRTNKFGQYDLNKAAQSEIFGKDKACLRL